MNQDETYNKTVSPSKKTEQKQAETELTTEGKKSNIEWGGGNKKKDENDLNAEGPGRTPL